MFLSDSAWLHTFSTETSGQGMRLTRMAAQAQLWQLQLVANTGTSTSCLSTDSSLSKSVISPSGSNFRAAFEVNM